MDPLSAIMITIEDDTPIFDELVQEQFNLMLNTTMRVELSKYALEK